MELSWAQQAPLTSISFFSRATYTTFEVGPEESEYKLHISGYVEAEDPDMRIGDGFSGFYFGHINDIIYTSHDRMNFSTFDRDNDLYQCKFHR